MYYFAFVLLALSMLCALAGAAWAVKSLWPRTAPAAGKASRRTSVPGLGSMLFWAFSVAICGGLLHHRVRYPYICAGEL